MFYPADDIDEIMPDALVQGIDQKVVSGHRTRMAYFTRRQETLEALVEMKRQAKKLEIKAFNHLAEGAKGVVPEHIMLHPSICVSYKHGDVTLNGFDNSTAREVKSTD